MPPRRIASVIDLTNPSPEIPRASITQSRPGARGYRAAVASATPDPENNNTNDQAGPSSSNSNSSAANDRDQPGWQGDPAVGDDEIQFVRSNVNPNRNRVRFGVGAAELPRPQHIPVGDARGNLRINEGPLPPGPHPRVRGPEGQRREIPRVGDFIGGFGAYADLAPQNFLPFPEDQANANEGILVFGGGIAPAPAPDPGPARALARPIGPPRVPEEYSLDLTHRIQSKSALQAQSLLGLKFSQSIIEPTINVETYEEDKTKIVGPLDDTTLICCCCDDALVMGAEGDRKLFALPCGHVIDGKCYWKLNLVRQKELEFEELERKRELDLQELERQEKEKAEKEKKKEKESEERKRASKKRVVVSDDDDQDVLESAGSHPRKSARISSSSSKSPTSKSSTISAIPPQKSGRRALRSSGPLPASEPLLELKPKAKAKRKPPAKTLEKEKAERRRVYVYCKPWDSLDPNSAKFKTGQLRNFRCPVTGCGMKVLAESGHRNSAVEIFC